jgi:hypothetical protein
VGIRLTCPKDGSCAGVIRLRAHGKTVGASSFFVPAGKSRTISIKLNKRGQKEFERRGKLPTTAQFKPQSGDTVTRKITFRAPKKRR